MIESDIKLIKIYWNFKKNMQVDEIYCTQIGPA